MATVILIDNGDQRPVTIIHGVDAKTTRKRLVGLDAQRLEQVSGHDLVDQLPQLVHELQPRTD